MAEKRHLVVSVFPDEAAAVSAAEWLRKWERTGTDVDDIRFGSMAVLTADRDGEIEVHRVGKHDTGAAAGVGLVIGALAGVLTAGVGLLAGMAAGALAGGLGGRLFHKGLGMYEGDLSELTDQLCSGRAALAVVVDEACVHAVSEQLSSLGGAAKVYECSLEELEKAHENSEE